VPDSEHGDVRLLHRIAGGDEGAMAEFYQRYGRVVFAQILLMVDERALGEEILQDTMLAIWRGAASFRGESRVSSWLIAIARRQARYRLRRRPRPSPRRRQTPCCVPGLRESWW
jgi:RNA polymerase sigma-70 factor (ECF subfamily)